MEGKRFLHSLRLRNFLSYGPEGVEIDLQPLNVLIGPNTSGKSNLIEAIGLLRAAPSDQGLAAAIRLGGGISEWLWKGSKGSTQFGIETVVEPPRGTMPFRYRLGLAMSGYRMEVVDESVEDERPHYNDYVYFYYRWNQGRPELNEGITPPPGYPMTPTQLRREEIKPEQSVLAQFRDPRRYPEITYLAEQFRQIHLYRENTLGPLSASRLPQKPDAPNDFLLEDATNLGLVLNYLQHSPAAKQVEAYLRKLHPNVESASNRIDQGSLQIYLHERWLPYPVPATRLSDGTMRYLCLLAVLCHPEPPPLVCIEEPELGLHPDLVASVAELLIEACQRTQIIVTTHSETLVAALSIVPEAVVVCERGRQGTSLVRLDRQQLEEWLERYSLGDLWRNGHIGGNP